jgi:hypothetical protein
MKLPGNFRPAPGFKWGPPQKDDSLDAFGSDAECKSWEVVRELCSLGDRNVVLLESTVKDVGKTKFGNNAAFHRKSLHYDSRAKRVRHAREVYLWDQGLASDQDRGQGHDYRSWFVNHIPGTGGSPLEEMLKGQRRGARQ